MVLASILGLVVGAICQCEKKQDNSNKKVTSLSEQLHGEVLILPV